MSNKHKPVRVRMAFGSEEVIAEMIDNPVSREFVSLLPLTLQFEDFARTEKIAYLPRKLKKDDAGNTSMKGDFAYYAPWGNLAVFYQGEGAAGKGLVIMGRIISGKDRLARMSGPFTATVEKRD